LNEGELKRKIREAVAVAVYQVLHTVRLAPPKFGTHGSFDGLLFGTTMTLETTVRAGEEKKFQSAGRG
jgi:hypothetical protein